MNWKFKKSVINAVKQAKASVAKGVSPLVAAEKAAAVIVPAVMTQPVPVGPAMDLSPGAPVPAGYFPSPPASILTPVAPAPNLQGARIKTIAREISDFAVKSIKEDGSMLTKNEIGQLLMQVLEYTGGQVGLK